MDDPRPLFEVTALGVAAVINGSYRPLGAQVRLRPDMATYCQEQGWVTPVKSSPRKSRKAPTHEPEVHND